MVEIDRKRIYGFIEKLQGTYGITKEKSRALEALNYAIEVEDVDPILIPYLKKINSHRHIYTVSSCDGSGSMDSRGFVVFRSMLSLEKTTRGLIVPLLDLDPTGITEVSFYHPNLRTVGFILHFPKSRVEFALDNLLKVLENF